MASSALAAYITALATLTSRDQASRLILALSALSNLTSLLYASGLFRSRSPACLCRQSLTQKGLLAWSGHCLGHLQGARGSLWAGGGKVGQQVGDETGPTGHVRMEHVRTKECLFHRTALYWGPYARAQCRPPLARAVQATSLRSTHRAAGALPGLQPRAGRS